MGNENKPSSPYNSHQFFHCIPVEDLQERNEINRSFWESKSLAPKINVERFLIESDFFPENLITTRSIVPITDISRINELLHEGINNNFFMGVRTISERPLSFGNKLPYAMEINSSEKIDTFISKTIPQWKYDATFANLDIRNIILMNNLPEIGTIEPHPNQFVARLNWDDLSGKNSFGTMQLTLEMIPGTNKLRDLDKHMESRNGNMHDVVRYEAHYSQTRFFHDAKIQIGINYFLKKFSDPGIFQIDKPFYLSPYIGNKLKPEKISYIDTIFEFLDRAIRDPNINLLKRMDFLSSIGLSSIEIQGCNDDQTNHHYARIYGLRGINDETKTGLTSFVQQRQ